MAGIGCVVCAAARNRLGRTGVSKFGRREAHSFGVLGRLARPCHVTTRRDRGLRQHPWIHPEPSWFLAHCRNAGGWLPICSQHWRESFGRLDSRLGVMTTCLGQHHSTSARRSAAQGDAGRPVCIPHQTHMAPTWRRDEPMGQHSRDQYRTTEQAEVGAGESFVNRLIQRLVSYHFSGRSLPSRVSHA